MWIFTSQPRILGGIHTFQPGMFGQIDASHPGILGGVFTSQPRILGWIHLHVSPNFKEPFDVGSYMYPMILLQMKKFAVDWFILFDH